MTRGEIEKGVVNKYSERYPGWKNVKVMDVVNGAFGGDIVVINAVNEGGEFQDEMCFIRPSGDVYIFDSTTHLVQFLEYQASSSVLDKFFQKRIVAGSAFLGVICVVATMGFMGLSDTKAFAALAGVLGLAAGTYFAGTDKTPRGR